MRSILNDSEFDRIDLRFVSSKFTEANALEKISVKTRLIPETAQISQQQHGVKIPVSIFEFFAVLVQEGKLGSIKSISATFTDGSVIVSD